MICSFPAVYGLGIRYSVPSNLPSSPVPIGQPLTHVSPHLALSQPMFT